MFLLALLVSAAVVYAVPPNIDTSHPIIYKYPFRANGLTYFGMSTLLRRAPASCPKLDSWILQVGAPRANVTRFPESVNPGNVFRCSLHGPCRSQDVDALNSGTFNGQKYEDRRDGSWVGVAMDILPYKDKEITLICGHRWADEKREVLQNVDVTYLMLGVCYMISTSRCDSMSTLSKFIPLLNRNFVYTPVPFNPHRSGYDWGLGQAGISVHIVPSGGGRAVIGAPGIHYSSGGVIDFTMPEGDGYHVIHFNGSAGSLSYAYAGYQVSSGKFFPDGQTWLVATGPRLANLHGEVLVFRRRFSRGVEIKWRKQGEDFGDFYGASLAVSDLNGDGLDDLVVGAPLHSKTDPDEGRVYVYLTLAKGNLDLRTVLDGNVPYGRFGTCLTGLGDIDRDGFNDLAVGAPYENDNRGAVYIYRGSRSGLVSYSHHIRAEELHSSLRGFGVSISRAVDIDENNYPDIAVGAYLSDSVVLLRAHPYLTLKPQIDVRNLSQLARFKTSFTFRVCSSYKGVDAPPSVNVTRTIRVDPKHNRAFFPKTNTSLLSSIITLSANSTWCEPISVKLIQRNSSRAGSFSSITIEVKLKVPPCGEPGVHPFVVDMLPEPKDEFNKWCPIAAEAEDSLDIPFAGECGVDNVCKSDLSIGCTVLEASNGSYVIGSSDSLTVALVLRNDGEPAHNVKVTARSDTPLKTNFEEFVRIADMSVDEEEPTIFEYRWKTQDNTMYENTTKYVTLEIDPSALKGPKFDLVVDVANVSSSDDHQDNNQCKLSLQLVSDARVELKSSSSNLSLSVSQGGNVSFSHYYEVKYEGQTPLAYANLAIHAPFLHGTSQPLSVAILGVVFTDISLLYNSTIGSQSNMAGVKDTYGASKTSNKTFFFNCEGTDAQTHCFEYYFTKQPLLRSAVVEITFFINYTSLEELMGDKEVLFLTTNGTLNITGVADGVESQQHSNSSITIHRVVPRVDTFIIALSILAGCLLLSLIISGMVRQQFFRRRTKEKLDALRHAQMDQKLNLDFLQNLEEE